MFIKKVSNILNIAYPDPELEALASTNSVASENSVPPSPAGPMSSLPNTTKSAHQRGSSSGSKGQSVSEFHFIGSDDYDDAVIVTLSDAE